MDEDRPVALWFIGGMLFNLYLLIFRLVVHCLEMLFTITGSKHLDPSFSLIYNFSILRSLLFSVPFMRLFK